MVTVAKRSKCGVKRLKDIELPSQAELYRIMEKQRKVEEKRKRKEERNRHRAFIQSGVKAGLTVKQILWIIRNFSPVGHEHWDGRVG
jgi:hypothetical protein